MNATNFVHAAIAAIAALLFGLPGAIAAMAWFAAREHTQAEYRWIETYGQGLRANMPWWGGFDLRVWRKVDPWLDMLLPAIACAAVLYGGLQMPPFAAVLIHP